LHIKDRSVTPSGLTLSSLLRERSLGRLSGSLSQRVVASEGHVAKRIRKEATPPEVTGRGNP